MTESCSLTVFAALTSPWISAGRRNCVVARLFRLRSRPGRSTRRAGFSSIASSLIARLRMPLRLTRYLRLVLGLAGVSWM